MTGSRAEHALRILEHIEQNPDATQAGLAEKLGVAVGTVNFTVKRLVKKGYVHVKQLERRRLRYIITPEGIALRTRLALDSLQYSMRLYRETREQAKSLIGQAVRHGYQALVIQGDGDLADICRLTCLEQGIHVQDDTPAGALPTLCANGTTLALAWPGQEGGIG